MYDTPDAMNVYLRERQFADDFRPRMEDFLIYKSYSRMSKTWYRFEGNALNTSFKSRMLTSSFR